ncbi:MAG: ABC transporter substrate-binding protein [Acidimicrobiales bacterium]
MKHPLRPIALAIAALGVVSCGADRPDAAGGTPAPATTSTTTAAPLTMASSTSRVPGAATTAGPAAPAAPKRIVSLSPTATESLFAIGAGPQVVAVDDQSNFPAEAPRTELSGFRPNVEAIAAKNPDLVVIADDSAKLADALGKLKIPVLVQLPAKTIDDVYAQIGELGNRTGRRTQADALTAKMKADLAAAVAAAPKPSKPLRYYHELDDTFYTVTSTTFAGQLYRLFGLTSIADAADDGSGFPQLSAEAILTADPDVIFLADTKCCKQSARTVAARPGWSTLKAVKANAVVELDDDLASRWGPRIVEFARAVAAGLPRS